MPPSTISDTAKAALTAAAIHPDHLVTLPDRLPTAAKRAVAQSMLKAGLVEEAPADEEQRAWRTGDGGERFALVATQAGLAAIDALSVTIQKDKTAEVLEVQAGDGGPDSQTELPQAIIVPVGDHVRLRGAAQAVLAAWDDTAEERPALAAAFEALRGTLALLQPPRRIAGEPRAPRPGTKQQAVVNLLRRPEGATVAQVAEATGWATHTVRGFFASLKKKGITVDVLERVRQVGSGKQGAKGSYTVYRVAEAG